ncbi:MAG: glycosyltransferase, partial [Anaerolineales bacterium]|nr:glycosyltransferase [Anaerolineales bacterium]
AIRYPPVSMNVALLHHSAPPVVGGVESVLAHQARLLADAGHRVRVVAARGAQTDPRIPFMAISLADSRNGDLAGLTAALNAGRVPPDFEQWAARIEAELNAALAGVEVVIAHNVCSLNKNLALTAALYRLSQRAGSPRLILWHHDLAWTTPRYRPELHDGYPWDLLRTAWPGVTQVVVSELRRRELVELMRLPPESVHVIPNGIDPARFYKLEAQTEALVARLKLAEAAPILLLPVRITPRKNIELALRVLAALTSRPPLSRGERALGGEGLPSPFGRGAGGEGGGAGGEGAALVVTGPLGPHNPNNLAYFESLRALRAELGLEGRAHFLAELSDDYLPDEVIADFYRLADALFLPSREEGFGLPVLEAALGRLPVFCADIEPLRALAGPDAVYFSPDADPSHVAGLIADRLTHDPAYQLAARTRRHFTWERVYAERIAPLLEER